MGEKGTVIIYGGAGFVGSHVADSLVEAGYKVRVYDLNPSPYLREGQEMIVGDILDIDAVCHAAKGCTHIYHFAGLADIDEAHHKPISTVHLNVLGTVNTLEAARQCGATRYVFASTVYVYSTKGTFYKVSKQAAEKYIETYSEVYGLDYTILRYGSLYGRRADDRNIIYRLLKDALRTKHLKYPGTGDELREYIHVLDAARSSVEILGPEFRNQHIVLTGNEKMRVRDLLMMISEILGGSINVEFLGKKGETHYTITPYAFHPTIGKKYINTYHIDMGQGLLDCLADIDQLTRPNHSLEDDWLVQKRDNNRQNDPR